MAMSKLTSVGAHISVIAKGMCCVLLERSELEMNR
jgi:hypothetical protein